VARVAKAQGASKVKSGIPGLDKITGGGFTPGQLIVVAGKTGCGRTTFGVEFLVNGIEDYNENGLLLSFDEKKKSVFANMASYGWDLAELERGRKFVFIEYPHNEMLQFVEQESAVQDLIEALGIKRVVIDSITPFALMFPEGSERHGNLMKLVANVRKWGCTTMVIAEDVSDPGHGLPKTVSGIELMADGIIHLTFVLEGKVRSRAIEVIKLRGASHKQGLFNYKIDTSGFSVIVTKGENEN
jgi:circadian clock protein KaiC